MACAGRRVLLTDAIYALLHESQVTDDGRKWPTLQNTIPTAPSASKRARSIWNYLRAMAYVVRVVLQWGERRERFEAGRWSHNYGRWPRDKARKKGPKQKRPAPEKHATIAALQLLPLIPHGPGKQEEPVAPPRRHRPPTAAPGIVRRQAEPSPMAQRTLRSDAGCHPLARWGGGHDERDVFFAMGGAGICDDHGGAACRAVALRETTGEFDRRRIAIGGPLVFGRCSSLAWTFRHRCPDELARGAADGVVSGVAPISRWAGLLSTLFLYP